MAFVNEMVGSLSNQDCVTSNKPKTNNPNRLATRFRFDTDRVMAHLNSHIAGQEEALKEIESLLRLVSVDITDPSRPLYVSLLLGPTGVGKTELVRTLTEAIHGTRDGFCRIDMNTLSQEHYAASLTGSPPGYAGSKEGITLLDKTKIEGSFSAPGIVLFDEVEKASDTVLQALLNVFDNGLMTIATGQQSINFRNALIFMTSNIGARELQDFAKQQFRNLNKDNSHASADTSGLTFVGTSKENRDIIEARLEETLSPEFLNRIDSIITFNWLTKNSVNAIIDMELARLNKRLERLKCHIRLDDSAMSLISDIGFDVRFGARAMKRAIRQHVEMPLADFLLENLPLSQNASAITHEKTELVGSCDKQTIRFNQVK